MKRIIVIIFFSFLHLLGQEEAKQIQDIARFRAEIADHPENAQAHYQLGLLLADLEQFDDALEHMRNATQLKPTDINAWFSLGIICCKVGKMTESIDAYQHIIKLGNSSIQVLYNLQYSLKTAGLLKEALKINDQIIAQDPNYAPAHLSRAFTYLMLGDYENAWKAHEFNLKNQSKNAEALRMLLRTGTISGKRILLTMEGGIGDTINFLRYADRLKQMGAIIYVAIQKELIPLCSRCPYIDKLFVNGQAMPQHDARATLMSLPALLYDTESTMASNVPYLNADPTLVEFWKEPLHADKNIKIGICWQASVHNDVSRMPIARRGIPLTKLITLAQIPNISLYSLQKIEGLEQLKDIEKYPNVMIPDSSFDKDPFMDTAAVMMHLDLVISVDTAIAHLAGALGRPVWLLLPYATDWRWIHNRTDSPWYPTMQVFQQPAPFDWDTVMQNVQTQLLKMLKKSSQ